MSSDFKIVCEHWLQYKIRNLKSGLIHLWNILHFTFEKRKEHKKNMIKISQCIFLLISLRRVISEHQRGFGGCEFSASHLQYHNVRSVITQPLVTCHSRWVSSSSSCRPECLAWCWPPGTTTTRPSGGHLTFLTIRDTWHLIFRKVHTKGCCQKPLLIVRPRSQKVRSWSVMTDDSVCLC